MTENFSKRYVVVMAAGHGSRMGSELPKQFLPLEGKPILRRTIEKFVAAVPDIKVVTVLPQDYIPYWKSYCLSSNYVQPQTIVPGGFTRFHSVKNALEKVPSNAIVAIHDGVRPLVSTQKIAEMFASMEAEGCPGALIPVVPTVDTLRVVMKDEDGYHAVAGETVDRSRVFGVQTPQIFRSDLIKAAYDSPYNTMFTDDASVAEKAGVRLSFCEGERYNIKITTPQDMVIAECIFGKSVQ